MIVSPPSLQVEILEDAIQETHIQAWLKEKHWELEAPCMDWNYWHIELGDGNILPITPSLLLKMYQRDHS